MLDAIYYILIVGMLSVSIFVLVNRDEEGSILGYSWFSVLTNSMATQKDSKYNGFYAGDLIVVKKMTYDQVKVNDIVTYKLGSHNQLTHRLIEKTHLVDGKEGDFLITKGDANNSLDAPVEAERLIGKVVYIIPKLGFVITFIKDSWIILICFIIFSFVIFKYYKKIFEVLNRKREQKIVIKKKKNSSKRKNTEK